jgi:Na+-driven multidrug efflux pump
MVVAVSTMFLFRIGFAYLLVYAFNAGVMAIWIAMVSDWVFRTILFRTRFEKGKWKNHNLIHN